MSTPSPAPYPSSGGGAATWSCRDVASPSPSPSPGGDSDVAVTIGQDCAVTSWGVDPVPSFPAASGSAITSATADDIDRLAQDVPGAAAFLIFLIAALVALQLRKAR